MGGKIPSMKKQLWILLLGLFSITPSLHAIEAFELPWMNASADENLYKSKDHGGGIFILETYFLNCPYCNDNAKNVNALHDRFSFDSRVQVLDVGVDRSESQYKEWIRRHQPNHPVLKDDRKKVAGALGTKSYPSTYVLDCKGEVLFSHSGVWDSEVKEKIEALVVERLWYPCEN